MTKDEVITVVEASWRPLDSSVEGLGEAALLRRIGYPNDLSVP